jgi:glycosyltransferase involved in cell wall biosynthesis
MKRVLAFTKYDTRAASTRQRFTQMLPYLEAQGISVTFAPLFDNAYLDQWMTKGTRRHGAVIAAYMRRARHLLAARNYDALWVHCELFPYLPGVFERLAALYGVPIIYDYDDAIFHQYDAHANPLVRAVLGRKLAPLLKRSALACCGNAYLEAYAAQYAPVTRIVPTTVDTVQYQPRPAPAQTQAVASVGWMGSPSTWAYCAPVVPVLRTLVEAGVITTRIVGAEHAAAHAEPFQYHPWQEAREVADLQAMDIGIMPIPEAPWARGKCGYKLIQYMACGLPVVASPVGVNRDLVTHGVNGFLADTPDEWHTALTTLAGDAALRERMGKEGRARVEAQYATQKVGVALATAMRGVMEEYAAK